MDIPKKIALVLSGGNALGAYHGGAYEALQEQGLDPIWIAGASIGAVTGALILGNVPEDRVERLREFWRMAEQFGPPESLIQSWRGFSSTFAKSLAAAQTLVTGRPGLFAPRLPGVWSALPGWPNDVSLFDSLPLRDTLERLLDFDRLNSRSARFTATAVDVETGEDVFFDTESERVTPEHIRASTAFPIAYPPVEISGRVLVDPGVSANLPVRAVLSDPPEADMFCVAVDLISATGKRPKCLGEAVQRAQDLLFANHSLHSIQSLRREYKLRQVQQANRARSGQITLLHVAYANSDGETAGKMFDYSAASVRERWAAGYQDIRLSLDAIRAMPAPYPPELLSAYRSEGGSVGRFPD